MLWPLLCLGNLSQTYYWNTHEKSAESIRKFSITEFESLFNPKFIKFYQTSFSSSVYVNFSTTCVGRFQRPCRGSVPWPRSGTPTAVPWGPLLRRSSSLQRWRRLRSCTPREYWKLVPFSSGYMNIGVFMIVLKRGLLQAFSSPLTPASGRSLAQNGWRFIYGSYITTQRRAFIYALYICMTSYMYVLKKSLIFIGRQNFYGSS